MNKLKDNPYQEIPPFQVPRDRPIICADIVAFREWYGFSVDECRIIFGIPISGWYGKNDKDTGEVLKKGIMNSLDEPTMDPAIAILLRYYAANPLDIPVLPKAHVEEFKEMMDGHPMNQWGVILGREAASGHRWVSKFHNFKPVTGRLAYYLVKLMRRGKIKKLEEWKRLYVEPEAKARGIDNIWESGSWNPGRKSKVVRKKKAKAKPRLVRKR